MINALLLQALAERASDVTSSRTRHVPWCASASTACLARRDRAATRRCTRRWLSRVKIMASLDIAEKRLPHDGRIALKLAGRSVECAAPRCDRSGERVVLRLPRPGCRAPSTSRRSA